MDNIIKLRKKEVPYEDVSVPVKGLAFYPENPRIYSRFVGTKDRTQENIQLMLESMEHVKELRSQIDKDGQINEPLFCIPVPNDSELHGEYDYQVLEGNSRLAALRMTKRGSLPQTSVRCRVLDLSAYREREKESLIFSLIGQFHITGKANWESYENAAYIYRRHRNQNISLDILTREIGKRRREIEKIIEAFELMTEAGVADHSRWSYFLAYVSSSKIAKHRKNLSNLDERVISLIKKNRFPKATDMRDSLPPILDNKKARKTFFDETESDPFGEALEIANISGDTNTTLKRLQSFRKFLGTDDARKQIIRLLKNSTTRGKTRYELDRILKLTANLVNKRENL